MAIEKNAVREGTRWVFDGCAVEVLEVTPRTVIFGPPDQDSPTPVFRAETITRFVERASDPASAEHDHLLKVFGSWHEGMAAPKPEDLHQALSYLLTRLGPPTPANMAPMIPPKAASVEAEPVAKVMPAVEDYVVALPHCEPLPEDRPVERKRRFA